MIITEVIEKYATSGRPIAYTPKVKATSYRVVFELLNPNQMICERWLQHESCFILVSNIPESGATGEDILKTYKNNGR